MPLPKNITVARGGILVGANRALRAQWAMGGGASAGVAFPDPEAVVDMDFIGQRYWWNGATRTTANFTTYNLNGSTFGANGITPSSTIDITLNVSAFWSAPGAFAVRVYPTSLPASVRTAFAVDSGVDTVSIRYDQNTNTNNFLQVTTAGATQAQIARAATTSAVNGAAASFDANDFRFYLNDIAGTADVSGTIPSVTILRIGKKVAAATEYAGAVGRVILYDSVQNNAWLQDRSNRIKT